MFFLSRKGEDGTYSRLVYHDGWLLTHPEEDFSQMISEGTMYTNAGGVSVGSDCDPTGGMQVRVILGHSEG